MFNMCLWCHLCFCRRGTLAKTVLGTWSSLWPCGHKQQHRGQLWHWRCPLEQVMWAAQRCPHCTLWALSLNCCCLAFQAGAPSGSGSSSGAWRGYLVGARFVFSGSRVGLCSWLCSDTKLARSHRADCCSSTPALGDCKYVGYMSQLLLLPVHHEQLWCKEMNFMDRLLPIHHHWFTSLLSKKVDNLQLRKIWQRS